MTFFRAKAHPVNLAVFRIALFLVLYNFNFSQVLWYSGFPHALLFPPDQTRFLLRFVPVNPLWAAKAVALFKAFCLTAMVGLCTPFSCAMAALLGWYVLGIPQFFGKVNHYHYLIWFPTVLAASRAGDFLSLDAVFASWRRADRGDAAPPAPARVYALPLRFIWVLFGIIYFFPGFWKALSMAGSRWASGSVLQGYLYEDWLSFNGWTPAWRIDQNPLICRSFEIATVAFELSFIFLIFSPCLRWAAVAGGLIFHNLSYFFMRILFGPLQACYVVFFNWEAIFKWLGRHIYREDMTLSYDGSCAMCRRAIATIRVLDIFGRVVYRDQPGIEAMQASAGAAAARGFHAWRALAQRVPVLWPFWPLLFIWPVTTLGEGIYQRVAGHRSCRTDHSPQKSRTAAGRSRGGASSDVFWERAVTAVAGILIMANVYWGAAKISYAWPFACFPTFDHMVPPTSYTIELGLIDDQGRGRHVSKKELGRHFDAERYGGLIKNILAVPAGKARREKLAAFWRVVRPDIGDTSKVVAVRFYRVGYSILPGRLNPVSREPL